MGQHEQSTAVRPLHGDWVPAFKVAPLDFSSYLMRIPPVLDITLGYRVSTEPHPEYPGVNVIDLFEADTTEGHEPPDLETAILANFCSRRYLLSIARSGLTVVTSRTGQNRSREVTLITDNNVDPAEDISCKDYEDLVSYRELTKLHTDRVKNLKGDPTAELPQEQADAAFRRVISYAT